MQLIKNHSSNNCGRLFSQLHRTKSISVGKGEASKHHKPRKKHIILAHEIALSWLQALAPINTYLPYTPSLSLSLAAAEKEPLR